MDREQPRLMDFSARRDGLILLALLAACVVILLPVLAAGAGLAPGLTESDGRTPVVSMADVCRGEDIERAPAAVEPQRPLRHALRRRLPVRRLLSAEPDVRRPAGLDGPRGLSILLHLGLPPRSRTCSPGCSARAAPARPSALWPSPSAARNSCACRRGIGVVTCAIPWLALILLSVEWSLRRPGRRPLLLGACAVALQSSAVCPNTSSSPPSPPRHMP